MGDFLGDLNDLRDCLGAQGVLGDEAFSAATLGGVITLDDDGAVRGVRTIRIRGIVPALPSRTSRPTPSYLTGTAKYWTGACKDLQRDLHQLMLEQVDHPSARAVLAFMARDDHPDLPTIPGFWGLSHAGSMAHEIPELLAPWRCNFRGVADLNPRLRGWPQYPMVRMGTRSNADSVISYGGNDQVLTIANPSGAGIALDWLMDRPTTVRHGNTAVIAWLSGDPQTDPTPIVIPARHHPAEARHGNMRGALHLAMLDARPPARASLRYYWSGDAAVAFGRIEGYHRLIRDGAPHYYNTDRLPCWIDAFENSPRWADMVMAILQAVLSDAPLPTGVMAEIVRLHRKPVPRHMEPAYAGILNAWAVTARHLHASD